MQLIFQNDHVVINLVGVLFGGCYRRSYFELCVCARGQWKVRILRIGEHEIWHTFSRKFGPWRGIHKHAFCLNFEKVA